MKKDISLFNAFLKNNHALSMSLRNINSLLWSCCFLLPHRSEVKARQDVKPDFRHPPFTDYRQPPVDYRHPPVTDYRQPPTLDYRQPPGLLDFRQHPAAAQFPLGIPADFRPQVRLDKELSPQVDFVYLFFYLFVFIPPHCRQSASQHGCIPFQ